MTGHIQFSLTEEHQSFFSPTVKLPCKSKQASLMQREEKVRLPAGGGKTKGKVHESRGQEKGGLASSQWFSVK